MSISTCDDYKTIFSPISRTDSKEDKLGKPHVHTVSGTFVRWTGEDVRHVEVTGVTIRLRIPWSVKRLRGTGLFTCTCQEFKDTCTKGTFIQSVDPTDECKTIFSESDEFDQLDGGYDFSKHEKNKNEKSAYCDHVARVLCLMCAQHDEMLNGCGIQTQK